MIKEPFISHQSHKKFYACSHSVSGLTVKDADIVHQKCIFSNNVVCGTDRL